MKVLYFSQAAQSAGTAEEVWPDPVEELDASRFWAEAIRRHPDLAAMQALCRLARNEQFLARGETIGTGDTVAVIPPVSGG